jgi:DNA-binding response OmpR family regulator
MEQTKKRILCVDDDKDTCLMLKTLFDMAGYEATSVMTVTDASRLAKQGSFDLYLLDLWFPDGTGIELCQYIRLFDSTTPILFCSSAAFETDIKKAMSAGAQGYLVKPTLVEDLMQTVRTCLTSDDVRSVVQ